MEFFREFNMKCTFQMATICARTRSPNQQNLKKMLYRIILTSPEMCLGNSEFAVGHSTVSQYSLHRRGRGPSRHRVLKLRSLIPVGVLVLVAFRNYASTTLEQHPPGPSKVASNLTTSEFVVRGKDRSLQATVHFINDYLTMGVSP